MRKKKFTSKLHLKKRKIAFLAIRTVKGGLRISDDTNYETFDRQSTCPIETCTCETNDTAPY